MKCVALSEVSDLDQIATVYNIRVNEWHTYYVGEHSWGFSVWAHNAYTAAQQKLRRQAQGRFQRVVAGANRELAGNLALAKKLLSPEELAAAGYSRGLAKISYGKALERLVRDKIGNANAFFDYKGGPNSPDFTGKGVYQGLNFDVTTKSQIGAHRARPGYGPGLIIGTYNRPPSFP